MNLRDLPQIKTQNYSSPQNDWMLAFLKERTAVCRGVRPNEIVMTNGLITRTWRLSPNAATVGFDNLMTGRPIIRGVKPEAILQLDGQTFEVGGLAGQEEYAYLQYAWLDKMQSDPDAFQFVDFETGTAKERFPWKRKRYSADLPWPPPGASLTLNFESPKTRLTAVDVSVNYEMYDGIPLICKWATIKNNGCKPVRLDTFINEILAVVECESYPERIDGWHHPNIHIESDYAFGGVGRGSDRTTRWVPDPQYTTQVDSKNPAMLEVRPPLGPDVEIGPGEAFETFRTFELIHDSADGERKDIALRRMYRTIAPWVTENPIFMHLTKSDPETVRSAIEQCAQVGFETVIISFGSGFDMENEDPAYIQRIKGLVDYGHSKGVELGGYSLLASRRVSDQDDVINPQTGRPGGAIFGNSPCLCSRWGEDYFRRIRTFIERTGLDLLEHDGSYPGDVCASTTHPGHRGLNDSQWKQWKRITDFYQWCRQHGVYLNVPDWYFLSGSNKTAMGYREVNWSLPRQRQIILGRQNIYDGTWDKTPSMGWMFVPLTQYHGGGEAATIEPLSEHLDAYEAHLAYNFGSGVQACYRGFRLYDTEKTKAMVKKWVDFYKKYRDILDSDIIHVRRPDGRDLDCILHVNPYLRYKGLAVVYNPLNEAVERTIKLPLYYAGLTDKALIRERGGEPTEHKLDRHYNVHLPARLAPNSCTWFLIE